VFCSDRIYNLVYHKRNDESENLFALALGIVTAFTVVFLLPR